MPKLIVEDESLVISLSITTIIMNLPTITIYSLLIRDSMGNEFKKKMNKNEDSYQLAYII